MKRLCLLLAIVALCVFVPVAVGAVMNNGRAEETVSVFEGSRNVLVLGRDNASGLCDALMLARINADTKQVVLLQIPRDTYINLGKDKYKKINGATAVLGSEQELCNVLSEALNTDIDGYVCFDSKLLEEMVDSIGGVELYVPMDMDYDDPYQKLSIHLKKGKQLLDGKSAVGFVRYRQGYLRADIGRMDAQKIFLSAFIKKALGTLGAKDVISLVRLALRYVKTDLPIDKLVSLGAFALKLEAENISFATMPGEEVQSKESGAWFYILSKSGCEKLFGVEFDKQNIFCDMSREEFAEIYNKKMEAVIHNAADVDGEYMQITPRK